MDEKLKKEVMAGSTNMADSLSLHRDLMGLRTLNPFETRNCFPNPRQMFSSQLAEKNNEQNPSDDGIDDARPCSS